MRRISDERALWLAANILPHEAELRAWLKVRRFGGMDVDDIIQETYARLMSIDTIESIRNPRTYAFSTAHSIVLAHARRAKIVSIQAIADLNSLAVAMDHPSPETQAADRAELQHLGEVIATFPARVREVFCLRRIDGLAQREIAERLGISENTVEKQIGQGILLLMECFGRGGRWGARASMPATTSKRDAKGKRERSTD